MSLQTKRYPDLACEYDCTGCMACIGKCKFNALKSIVREDGHVYVEIDRQNCIGCMQCEKVCSLSRNNFGNNNLNESRIYAGWAAKECERKNATSGGVFSALAKYILQNGGIVVGASLEGKKCRHIIIKNMNELKKIQGSKYMSSSMDGIYKIIEQHIEKKQVLFSGVGCQCAGVLAYFSNHKNKDNLYTIDLVCGGAPSRILVDKFYEHFPEIEQIVSFREKDQYVLKVLEKNNIKEIHDKSLPLHGFNCELTNRYSCYHCQFACAHRQTDITIGDLWNYNYLKEEHAKGISTIIVHSERGLSILRMADVVLNEISWNESLDYCKRIVCGKTPIFSPRKKLIENAKTMPYEKFRELYCMDIKPTNITMFAFRVYRYLIMHLYNYRAKNYIRRLEKEYSDYK